MVDKTVCLQNIGRMAEKAKRLNLRFRPHFKTHQSAKTGEWFRPFGVTAITVSSVSMARYFAQNGWNDITIAFPVNIREIGDIDALAASVKLNLLVENTEAISALTSRITSPVGFYLKIDTGYHRTGISPQNTRLIDSILVRAKNSGLLSFKGFLAHSGHTYHAKSAREVSAIHAGTVAQLKILKQKYKTRYPVIEVSVGDTPSCSICENFDGVDEIRPGNFIFYDLMQATIGSCSYDDIAVKVVCPVVSKHTSRNEVVVYGGAVHLSKEFLPGPGGNPMYGRISVTQKNGRKLLGGQNYVSALSQEHGILKVSHKNLNLFEPGGIAEILPVHSCLAADLLGGYLTTENEFIETKSRF